MSTEATQPSESAARGFWLMLGTLAAIWLPASNQLRVEWSINAQYSYGWTVPFLGLYLFIERWRSRPPTTPIRSKTSLILVAALLGLLWVPLRLVQEASPDWRLVSWAMTGLSVVFALTAFHYAGGWSWLRHFWFPIGFLLVAVPWPVPIEYALTQKMMHGVTAICVESLGWCAIPATQQGNVIATTTGLVGVEEACSGVRSLQTTLMAALFLGELFRLTLVRRFLLLIGGVSLAFACNVGRSFFLTWLSATSGADSVAKWHDWAGLIALVMSMGGLAGLAALLRPKVADAEDSPALTGLEFQPRLFPRRLVFGVVAWVVLVEAATEVWYRAHESPEKAPPMWSISWPVSRPQFQNVKLPEVTRAMLLYNEGRSGTWTEPDQSKWSMVFIRWNAGRASAQLARSHGPELCLPATGAILNSDLGLRSMQVHGLDLPVRVYLFTVREKPLYVFYCRWEDTAEEDGPKSSWQNMTYASRLQAVWKGRRNKGQQVLELAVSGHESVEAAESATHRLLEAIIR